MIALIFAAAMAAQTPPPEAVWTWTLYGDAAPVVLANELPDSPNLRATLECDPGSSIARLTIYGGAGLTGIARVSSGQTTAVAQAESARAGGVRLALRTDHPVFAAFGADGRLSVAVGEQRRAVEVPQVHLAKLRHFAELCSG